MNVLLSMLYLAGCGVSEVVPDKDYCSKLDMSALYKVSRKHLLTALIGISLTSTGLKLPDEWEEEIQKAIRKNVLFDIERAKLLSFMEQKGIWYLILKGIVLKDFYPAVGMRQMSDNDILFDCSFCDDVQEYMESQGYEAVSIGVGNHDVYKKNPVYNFELHRTLYGEICQDRWGAYYGNIKERLVLSSGTSYGYQFTDEDFYVYIVAHAYKHYTGAGTGLRTLLDFYVYLKAKEADLDFAYIKKECEVLGIAEFEQKNRSLCKKVFDAPELLGMEDWERSMSVEEKDMLLYYLTSGTYGSMERNWENAVRLFRKKSDSMAKLKYMWKRLFPGYDTYKFYAGSCKSKFVTSLVGWFRRALVILFTKSRRELMKKEIKTIKKMKKERHADI